MNTLLPSLQEARLLKRLRENDRDAFEVVVDAHYTGVYRQLYHLTNGDATTAADLTQETFITAWQSLSRFQGRSRVGTWLHTIAVRVWYREVRENRRTSFQTPLSETLVELLADPSTGDLAGRASTQETQRLLEIAVNGLPPTYRSAVMLFYREELKYREIAERENIAVGTVKSRLAVALRLLRERLALRKDELL